MEHFNNYWFQRRLLEAEHMTEHDRNAAAPERDPIIAAYFTQYPGAYQDVLASLEKIDKRSVDQTRQCKIVLWRLAGKIADSGTTGMTHEQLYEHIKKVVEI